MKSRTVRIFSLIIALLMFSAAAASCGDKNKKTAKEGESTATVSTPDQSGGASEEERYNPGNVKFGKVDYNMFAETNMMYSSLYICEDENPATSAIIDYALYVREAYMREIYEVNLKLEVEPNAYNKASVVLATDYLADALFIPSSKTIQLARDGYLLNVLEIEQLNLEASYWDQRIQKEYRILDKLFMLEGDYTIAEDLKTYIVVYNHTIYENLGYNEEYGTPYALASEGTWTLDTMTKMMKGFEQDLNEDGIWDARDRWGMVGENAAPFYFFLGGGYKTITNNSGTLKLEIEDKSYLETVLSYGISALGLAVNPSVITADRDIKGNDMWGEASDIFKYDRAIFRSTALHAAIRLLDMTSVYGILPIPAMEEDQDGYYCWVSPYGHYPLAFPKNISSKIGTVAQITEVLNYTSRYSTDSLYYAFYDLLAYSRLSRTADDKRMLELIFANKTYDFDTMASLSGFYTLMSDLSKSGDITTFSSQLDSITGSTRKALQTLVAEILSKT